MPYLYATERPDYSDLSSGRVLHSLPGHPAFPIRLASEMLQRCLARQAAEPRSGPCELYDPCCGAGYLLASVAFLHREQIGAITASDIDARAVSLAERNLSMLTVEGLDRRIAEITSLLTLYGKESHQAALESARRLRAQVAVQAPVHPLQVQLFQADATDGRALAAGLNGRRPDIVLTDIPYGQNSQWHFTNEQHAPPDPAWAVLEGLRTCLAPRGIVAIAADKGQKIAHSAYQRLEHFHIGKRQVVVLKATSTC